MDGRSRTGVLLALLMAATFGTSGIFATALMDAGWSPAATVTIRVTLAAAVLTAPALVALRRHWARLRSDGAIRRSIAGVGGFGLISVAGCQLAYFSAVQRLDVGVALLLEYLGVVLVVAWMWVRHGQRPRRLTAGGSAVAIIGLVLVLDLTGSRGLDPIGVAWALIAAVGLASFYLLSGGAEEPLPPVVFAWAGLSIGALVLALAGATGLMPWRTATSDVVLAGRTTSWLVPVLGLAVVASAIPYIAGIAASRRLGAKLASFLGLPEVIFAVLFAWLLLGQVPTALQLVGGAVIVAGISLVRIDELGRHRSQPSIPRSATAPRSSARAASSAS